MDVEDSATVEERLNDHLYRAPFIPTSRRQSGRRNALTLIFRFILMRPFETRPVSFFPSVAPLPSPPLPSSLSLSPTYHPPPSPPRRRLRPPFSLLSRKLAPPFFSLSLKKFLLYREFSRSARYRGE